MPKINKLLHPFKARRYYINKSTAWRVTDMVVIAIIILTFIALLVLVYYQLRPVQTVDIKVPVATDKAEYYAGEQVSGIFFGEVFYTGRVQIVRDVFCKDYTGRMQDNGDEVFTGASVPMKLEGTSRRIGTLPNDVPVGLNCVIQFVNTYKINTPFGDRTISDNYYTQNFQIIARPQEPGPASEQRNDPQDGVCCAEQPPTNPGGSGGSTLNGGGSNNGNPGTEVQEDSAEPVGASGGTVAEPAPQRSCSVVLFNIMLLCD